MGNKRYVGDISMFYIDRMKELQDSGIPFALVTVTEASDSTPREIGSNMLVETGGTIVGTIGGGPVERMALDRASEMLKNGETAGLCEYSLDSMKREEKREAIISPGKKIDTGAICGGRMSVFIQCFFPPANLLIAGGGHIALCLHNIASEMDMAITIVDNRKEYASKERFPKGSIICGDYADIFSNVPLVSPTYIVILTHGHVFDQDVLDAVAGRDWENIRYVGMIGSRRKVGTIIRRSKDKGNDARKLGRVHSPIGLDIGAATPQEIAVAIMAEIIGIKHGKVEGTVGHMSIVKELF